MEMKKIIKHVSELPAWYDLSKYSCANSMCSGDWYQQLAMRKDLLSLVGSQRWLSWKFGVQVQHAEKAYEVLELLRSTPIIRIDGNQLLETYFYPVAVLKLDQYNFLTQSGVRFSSVRNIYNTESRITEQKQTYARKIFHQKNSHTLNMESWIDDPVDNATEGLDGWEINLRVNTLLPDEILLEQFKKLMRDFRDSSVLSGRSPKYLYNNWISAGLLPFLDLQIWQKEMGVKIVKRVIADAIFKPGEGGEEIVRKTTEKYATEYLTSYFLTSLASHAAQEKAEKMSS